MKKTLFIALSAILLASCCQKPCTEISGLPAKWLFNTENTNLFEATWTGEEHYVGSMTGSPARITVVSAVPEDQDKFEYRVKTNKAEVNNLAEGDYILFSTPAGYIEAGSHIEIDAVVMSSPDSPKYFIAEIFDGKEWKSVERDLRTAEENPEIKYTFMCSGTGSKAYQHNSVYQTFRISKAIKRGELKIRFRAVGDIACNGKSLTEKGKNGWVGFAGYGFIGAYIQNYGTEVPKDTTSILCLGNSFTYYCNSASMMKELAWSQGHYFDVFAHLKGGQHFGQHTQLLLSHDAMKAQVYDYAILQDQSMAAANYINDPKKYAYVPEDYLKLSEMVLEHSPECQLILEHTWGYEKENCKGFNTIENFNNLLREGVNYLAGLNGATPSHIGDAFFAANGEFKGNLYASDNHHQSHYGSYLKACVNYLMITKEPFNEKAADCGISPERAEYLRKTAEKIVLGE